jgi:dTMP kinase
MITSRTRFITLEGSEGCGKSTQLGRLQTRLQKLGHRVVATREPGGTSLGETLRFLLKHAKEGHGMCPETELLMFAASRAQLSRTIIRPALELGGWVLCDRYGDSTTVYQGVARGLETSDVEAINKFAMGTQRPGLTIILDLSLEEAMRRLLRRPRPLGDHDRIENQPPDFFGRVRSGYLALAEKEPERVKLIHADAAPDEVEQQVWNLVKDAFSL